MIISVVIPCKNEPYLRILVDLIHNSLVYPHEILVQTEPGLALAVLCGVRKSKGDVIVVLDADGSHNPQNLTKMIGLVQTYPIVIGSRYVEGGVSNDTVIRRFLSRLFCRLAGVLLKVKVEDSMSGFVAAKRQVFETVHLQPIGYKFALELLVKCDARFRILEYPIIFQKRKMGSSKTGVKEGIKIMTLILALWIWKISHKH